MNDQTIMGRGDAAAAFDALAQAKVESTSIVPAGVFAAPAERVFGAQPVAVQRDEAAILQKLKVMAGAAGDDWYYRFPVKKRNEDGSEGKDWIEGPSIKCANNVARLYGNCDIDVRVFDAGSSWMFYARFMDLETGYSLVRPFNQRKSQKVMKTDAGRAEDIVFQIGASKAIRNVINNALEFFSNFAMEEAKASIIERVGKKLDYYRGKVGERLAELRVDLKRVETVRGRVIDQWVAADVARTIAEIQAIQDGMATIDDTYPPPGGAEAAKEEATAKSLGEKLDAVAQSGGGAVDSGAAPSGGEASPSAHPGGASPAAATQTTAPQQEAGPLPQPTRTAAQAEAAPDPAAQAGTQPSPAPSGAAEAPAWPDGKIAASEAEYVQFARAWFAKVDAGKITPSDAIVQWKADKTIRNRVHVTEDVRDGLKADLDKIIAAKKAG